MIPKDEAEKLINRRISVSPNHVQSFGFDKFNDVRIIGVLDRDGITSWKEFEFLAYSPNARSGWSNEVLHTEAMLGKHKFIAGGIAKTSSGHIWLKRSEFDILDEIIEDKSIEIEYIDFNEILKKNAKEEIDRLLAQQEDLNKTIINIAQRIDRIRSEFFPETLIIKVDHGIRKLDIED